MAEMDNNPEEDFQTIDELYRKSLELCLQKRTLSLSNMTDNLKLWTCLQTMLAHARLPEVRLLQWHQTFRRNVSEYEKAKASFIADSRPRSAWPHKFENKLVAMKKATLCCE